MNCFTLNELTNRIWYIQQMTIKDSNNNILFDGDNISLRNDIYKPLRDRWVSKLGAIDGKLIINVA